MAQIQTVQQFYAVPSTEGKGIVAPEDKEFALEIPDSISQYSLTSEKLNILDIVPFPIKNEKHPLVVGGMVKPDGSRHDDVFMYYVHRYYDDTGNEVICNYKTYGTKCPICEERNNLYKAEQSKGNPEPWKAESVKKLSARPRVAMNVIDVREPEKGIQILIGSEFYLRQGILKSAEVNRGDSEDLNNKLADLGDTFTIETPLKNKELKTTEYIYFASPTNGFSVVITGSTEVFEGNEFVKPIKFELRERKTQYAKDIVNQAHDLASLINTKTYDEVKAMFYGVEEKEEETFTAPAVNDREMTIPLTEVNVVQPFQEPELKAQVTSTPVTEATVKVTTVPPSEAETMIVSQQVVSGTVANTCTYGHKLGLDYETKPECSECLDNDPKQYTQCMKAKREIESL